MQYITSITKLHDSKLYSNEGIALLYIYLYNSRIWIKKQGMGAFIQSLTLLEDQIFLCYEGVSKNIKNIEI